jgi:hypothetical protein
MLRQKCLLVFQVSLPLQGDLRAGTESEKYILVGIYILFDAGRASDDGVVHLVLSQCFRLHSMVALNRVNIIIDDEVPGPLQREHVVVGIVVDGLPLTLVHNLMPEGKFALACIKRCFLVDSKLLEDFLLHVLGLVKLQPKTILE